MSDTLILNRNTFTNKSTIGDLLMDGVFQCFVLEPTCRKQEGVKLAIPAGKYELALYDSPKNRRSVPLLKEVPGHSFVEIHIGNAPKDTEDCLLPGRLKEPDFVGESELAFNKLLPKIEEKLKQGKVYIDIIGGVQCGNG